MSFLFAAVSFPSPSPPRPSPVLPRALWPQPPPRCPWLVWFSLGQPPWALPLVPSRCLGLTPVGTFLSSPFFLYLSSFISPPLPFVFPAPSGCCEGQKGGSRAGLPLTEVTSHCGGRRCAKTKAGSGRCHREGVQRDTRGPLRACSSDGTGLQPCAVLSPSVVSSPCTAGCRLLRPFNPTGRDTGVGCHFLLQASSRPGTEPRSSAL